MTKQYPKCKRKRDDNEQDVVILWHHLCVGGFAP